MKIEQGGLTNREEIQETEVAPPVTGNIDDNDEEEEVEYYYDEEDEGDEV